MTIAIAVAEKPTSNDAREPQSSRPSTSRPDGSVPSQWPPLGASLPRAVTLVTSSRSIGMSTGASSASAMMSSSSAAPITADGCEPISRTTSVNRARRRARIAALS